MRPNVTREDIEREVANLRALLDEYPSFALLLDKYDPDEISLSVIHRPIVLASRSRPSAEQRAAFEDRQAVFRTATSVINRQYVDGQITLQEWSDLHRQQVKDLHISAYIAGMNGEWADMTAADWGRLGQIIRTQYAYLANWATQLAGTESPSLAQMNQRSGYYAAAASNSFSQGRATRAGFRPSELPAHPGDGSTECRTNCKCYWLIVTVSKSRGDYNATWRLGNAEHCRTCRRRAAHWRSLKIRGGRLETEVEPIAAA